MYVVTGATGNTGSVVARRLLQQKKQVRVIARSVERLREFTGAEPFVAELTDTDALTKAFTGAEAVYAMIPPNVASPDPRAYQERISDSISQAVAAARVSHVVALSSVGADKPSGTGPVVGLYNFEQKLNRIPGLNTLHLRPAYFMENTLAQAGIIPALGAAAGPLRGDLKLPMIATRDIGVAAADELLQLNFRGNQARELLGPRDYTMNEIAAIIGRAIGKPGLQYLQIPDEQIRPAMIQMGMSASMVDLLLEMSAALNSGHMVALEPRSPRNATTTTYETFVAENFVPAYRRHSTAA